MKATTAYALAWISTAIAVSVTVYVTKSAMPLWGMLIPTFISFSTKSDNKDDKEN